MKFKSTSLKVGDTSALECGCVWEQVCVMWESKKKEKRKKERRYCTLGMVAAVSSTDVTVKEEQAWTAANQQQLNGTGRQNTPFQRNAEKLLQASSW